MWDYVTLHFRAFLQNLELTQIQRGDAKANAYNVPIKSIALEIAACSFVGQWTHNHQSISWYHWMVRDFFAFLLRYQNGTAQIPGIQENISLGNQWGSRCESAYSRAAKACDYEQHDHSISAEDEWKKIFGGQFTRAN